MGRFTRHAEGGCLGACRAVKVDLPIGSASSSFDRAADASPAQAKLIGPRNWHETRSGERPQSASNKGHVAHQHTYVCLRHSHPGDHARPAVLPSTVKRTGCRSIGVGLSGANLVPIAALSPSALVDARPGKMHAQARSLPSTATQTTLESKAVPR